jgi:hypothetical protein
MKKKWLHKMMWLSVPFALFTVEVCSISQLTTEAIIANPIDTWAAHSMFHLIAFWILLVCIFASVAVKLASSLFGHAFLALYLILSIGVSLFIVYNSRRITAILLDNGYLVEQPFRFLGLKIGK